VLHDALNGRVFRAVSLAAVAALATLSTVLLAQTLGSSPGTA
jgi:hypothetical protein